MFFRLFLLFSLSAIFLLTTETDVQAAVHKKKKLVKKRPTPVEKPSPEDEFCSAAYALLIEDETGKVLFEKNPDAPMDPASITKMLTAYIVMDQLAGGVIKEDTLFSVSANAFKVEGSSTFLNLNDQIRVIDLLRGLIIQSGNDAAIVLAEGISGTEKDFADLLNRKAKEIGMKDTHFTNASGLPNTDHKTTARDLLLLSKRLHDDFPQYYPIWAEQKFTLNGVSQDNRNPLLYKNIGCDGLKTGSTSISGFGIAASCSKNGRRLYALTNGSKTSSRRARDILSLINYGFSAYDTYTLFPKGHIVDQIPVWYGSTNKINVGFENGVVFTEKKIDPREIKVEFQYAQSLKAPIQKGDVIGKISVTLPGAKAPIETPITCLESVEPSGFLGKLYDGLVHLFGGRPYNEDHKKTDILLKK